MPDHGLIGHLGLGSNIQSSNLMINLIINMKMSKIVNINAYPKCIVPNLNLYICRSIITDIQMLINFGFNV